MLPSVSSDRPTPTPRLMEALCDPHLSPSAKVLYALLDEIGRGRSVIIEQTRLAELLSISRKTVSVRLMELRTSGFISVNAYLDGGNRHALSYRTRVTPDEPVRF